ncbi:CRISPR-associated protein Csx3 [uncultured Chloroflexus sp.]|uniref:CRISPR-associated protein Csx3 n=1 Tax=uncultured Chloroflexus sp. TaxID=214040 RepID=UPI0026301800|nr:CRISPR-associated protein Csx3 [uncultured Chloroflexus sp.]
MQSFPAVMIGGPPHSGKSVLVYRLSQMLRAARVEHYVLRACPDGEGDWIQETSAEQVRLLRQKGQFSNEFVERVHRDIAQRHLPLLVDVGGKPTLEQEQILRACTHAVLLAASPNGLSEWRERSERCGLSVIAELQSVLHGADRIDEETPVLRGVISGLERQRPPNGVMVTKLSERLTRLFTFSSEELKRRHFQHAPTELVVDLDRLAHVVGSAGRLWQPSDLPQVFTEVPAIALSLYGRGPNWLYAALALHAASHEVFLFDPRLGWVQPSVVALGHPSASLLQWRLRTQSTCSWLEVQPLQPYLDYDEMRTIIAPPLDPELGVILSGKLPYWLLVGLALAYRCHPWLAVVQAQQYGFGVVVMSRDERYRVGDEVSVDEGSG